MTDVKTLIFRAQAGDEQAFANLMQAHYAFVYTIVIGIVDNPEDAEEVVQDTFVNVYRGLAQYEERTKFRGWLAKIARNRALNWMRDQRSENVSINDVQEHKLQTSDALAEQLILAEQKALIRGALETLSPKDWQIARSYYLDGASYDELIRTHGLSYKAISVRLSRAKRKLSIRLRHLLTGLFVSPATTLKQICTGGLTVMKVGTVSKITVSAAAIIGLGVIGTHHFILSKEDSSPSVEIVTSTPSGGLHSVARTDSTHKRAVAAPQRANEPQISAEEMEQIESFFAQLEQLDTQDVGITEEEVSAFETNSELQSTELSGEEDLSDVNEQKQENQLQALAAKVVHIARAYENILLRRKALAAGASPEDFGITGSQEYEEYKSTKWNLQNALSDYLHARGPHDIAGGWIYEELEGMAEFWFDGENQLYISITDRMLKER